MINLELLNYIKDQKNKGISDVEIRKILLNVGWEYKTIEKALVKNSINKENEKKDSNKKINEFLNVSTLFSKASKYYKINFWKIFITVIPAILISVILLFVPNIFARTFILHQSSNSFIIILLYLIFHLIAIFLDIVVMLSIINIVNDNKSVVSGYKKSIKQIFSYIWIFILMFLIIFAGTLLFFVPGTILAYFMIFSFYVMIVENERGLNAIVKSREYIRGYGTAMVFKLIFGSMMIGLIWITISFIFSIFLLFTPYANLLKSILNIFIKNVFILPLGLIYVFFIYSNLKFLNANIIITNKKKIIYKVFSIIGLVIILLIVLSFLYVIFSSSTLTYGKQIFIENGRYLGF